LTIENTYGKILIIPIPTCFVKSYKYT